MKKTTRILALTLVFVMALGLLPITAGAVTVTEVVPCQYENVGDFSEGLAAVSVGKFPDYKWGFIDKTGKEAVPCKYENDSAPEFHEGLAAVKLNGKWGFIDKTGKEVVPCKYDDVRDFSDDLVAVKGKSGSDHWGNTVYGWGFVDKTGKEVVPCKYKEVSDFSGGLAAVNDGDPGFDEWGFIDKTGKEVVPYKYYSVGESSDGLTAVKGDSGERDKRTGSAIIGWGFINTTGQEVVPCKYSGVKDFDQGLAAVSGAGGWGFIDTAGKEVIPCKYGEVENFSEGLAAVKGDSGEKYGWGETIYKWGFIDKTGKEVVPCKYKEVSDFSGGLAAVYGNGGWGFVDTTGKQVVPYKYDDARDFSEGLAAVKGIRVIDQGITVDGWGFIDKTGKEVVLRKYYGAEDFYGGVAQVRQYYGDYYGHYGFVNKAGVEVAPCIYRQYSSNLQHVSKDIIWANLDDNGYLADRTGKLCEVDYADMREMHEGLVAAMIYGKWGFISIDGYTPTVDQPPAPTAYTAKATNDKLTVGGVSKTPTAYKINNANYFQLRDVAVLLNNTKAQFSVDYDNAAKAIKITTGQPYQPNGKEMKGAKATAEAIAGNNDVYINGIKTDFAVYKIGGSNFFQIRDLGKALGFNVDWAKDVGIIIDPSSPYSGK